MTVQMSLGSCFHIFCVVILLQLDMFAFLILINFCQSICFGAVGRNIDCISGLNIDILFV